MPISVQTAKNRSRFRRDGSWMQVNYDYTFDSCQPEADAIFESGKDVRNT